jgi:hypothetical protein
VPISIVIVYVIITSKSSDWLEIRFDIYVICRPGSAGQQTPSKRGHLYYFFILKISMFTWTYPPSTTFLDSRVLQLTYETGVLYRGTTVASLTRQIRGSLLSFGLTNT